MHAYLLCIMFIIVHMEHVILTYKLTSSSSTFIFTVVMKVRVKASVLMSKYYSYFDIL